METSRTTVVLEPETPPRPGRRPVRPVRAAMSVRLAASGGVLFFVLVMLFATMTSGSPSASDSRPEIFTYFADHHDRLQLAAVLYAFAMPAALLLLSGLFRALRRAEGGLPGLAVAALGGGVLAAASSVIGALVLGTVATRYADLGPAGTRVGWTMFLLGFGATLLGLLLLIGATAVICLQTGLFPRWFAGASVVLALASIAGAVTIGYDTTALQTVAGITVLLDSVWVLLVSTFLWRYRTLVLP